jgi:CRISPR/Cas system-associated exonuclease Cas4 (RecB family)
VTLAPPATATGGDFSWSVSRHDSFQSCKRRYFLSYYAAAHDPEIYRLKKLSALPLWAGNAVHDSIESFLREAEGIPDEAAREALIRRVVHERMLAEWRESESAGDGFRLFEHEYGQDVSQEDKRHLVGIVMRSLRAFFGSETLREAFEAGKENWLALEELADFEVEGVPVKVRMDLAYRRRDGGVVIVDWKTGRFEGRFSEVQVVGYALYAAEHGWADDPLEIETELAYLAIPRFVRRRLRPESLKSARSFIQRSAGRMRELLEDEGENRARLEDFPMIDRPSICRRCGFRRLCFPPRNAPESEAAEATSLTTT